MKKAPTLVVVLFILAVIGVGAYSARNNEVFSSNGNLDNDRAPATQGNTMAEGDKAIGTMLAEVDTWFSSGAIEDRKQRARALNDAYFRAKSPELRKRISDALSRLLRSESDPDVARALALSHSRLYFDENTLPNLKDAYARKILSFDDYYGELAHVFPGAPPGIREEIVSQIAGSHNRYAVDIVASNVLGANGVPLSEGEKTDIQKFLRINEPIFSGAADAYGQFEAIRYEQWLLAAANLAKSTGAISTEQFIADKLLDPKTDPRALVALSTSPYVNSLTPEQRSAGQWDLIQSRAREFISKNPNNASLQLAGQQIATNTR
jgi:hypothetical protein